MGLAAHPRFPFRTVVTPCLHQHCITNAQCHSERCEILDVLVLMDWAGKMSAPCQARTGDLRIAPGIPGSRGL